MVNNCYYKISLCNTDLYKCKASEKKLGFAFLESSVISIVRSEGDKYESYCHITSTAAAIYKETAV